MSVTTSFSSSHQLRNYCGKCENMHGHNFGVELCVEGDRLTPDTEILVDFKVLKQALNQVLDALDHRHLNEVPPFDAQNPSSENLARHIYRDVAALLRQEPVRVAFVAVSEKDSSRAEYSED
jgi:6-pyruvoyltetrahydropterin/6-carboxytetrahydropterin synthase